MRSIAAGPLSQAKGDPWPPSPTTGSTCHASSRPIIKDVTTHPSLKIGFASALHVLMTRGFEMWCWDERQAVGASQKHFTQGDTFPVADWMPYPHIVYLCESM